MSVIQEIRSKENKISELKREIRSIESEIRHTESNLRQVRNSKNMGLVYMTNSTLRPLGTYKFISGSNNEMSLNSELSRLKSKKSDLEWKLRHEERELDDLEDKYKHLPEAKLTSSKFGIHFEDDKEQKDILEPLRKKMEQYAVDHKRIRESKAVAEYVELNAQLSQAVQNGNFPDATPENIEQLRNLKNMLRTGFDYMVYEGKILVDSDFVSRHIEIAEDKMKNLQRKIDENQQRRDVFEPTFWGKVFKRVGQKQRDELETKIKNVDLEYQAYYTGERTDFKYYSQMKEKYVDPMMAIKDLIEKYKRSIALSTDVCTYKANPEKYQRDIDENTILQDIDVGNIPRFLIGQFKTYLDNHDLTLTEDTIMQAICESEHHKELAAQLIKMTGYKPKEKQAGNEKS